jgi:nucleoside 2-deoxyribosyltransferase
MPAKLRCFVAMAFGQKDTDAIFRALRKTLGPLGVNAQRVDRIEHNDNIDTRIISEIEAADLVIADLTYARPSVYFEAGYAQRAIPVIFTARSDHFRERDDDPNGNRHVHFDLKMRNIIAWSGDRALLVEGIAEALLLPAIAKLHVLQNDAAGLQRFRGAVLVAIDGVDFSPYVEVLATGLQWPWFLQPLVAVRW